METRRMDWLAGLWVLALVVAACGSDISEATTTTSGPGTTQAPTTTNPTTTTTAPAPSTTLPPRPPVPSGIVVYGPAVADGRPGIAVIDPDTGKPLAVLIELGEPARDLFVDPSAGMLYYTKGAPCPSQVIAADVSTSDERVVAQGSHPVVSPDGRYLAYSVDPACSRQHDVHVRDLADGSERVWASEVRGESDLPAEVLRLSWAGDSARLAVELRFEDGTEIRLIDATEAGGEIYEAGRLVPPDLASWESPLFSDDGSLLVVESCCDFAPDDFRIVAVDTDTGATRAINGLNDPARLLAAHPTAEGVLLLVNPSSNASELWLYRGGEIRRVAGGITAAAWLVGHGAPVSSG